MATKKKKSAKKEMSVEVTAPAPTPSVAPAMPAGKWHHGWMPNPTHGHKRNQLCISPISPGYATPEAAMAAPIPDIGRADLHMVVFVGEPL